MPSSVTDLIQRLVDRVAAADPIVATQLGMVEHAGELPDLSAPALAAYLADARRLLELLDEAATGAAGAEAIDAVTGGQIARRVLRSFETRRVQHAKPGLYLDAAYGVLLLMIKEVGTPAERVEAMAGRLRALPGVLEEGLANLRAPLPHAVRRHRSGRRSRGHRAGRRSARRGRPPSSASPARSTGRRAWPPPP